MNELEKICFGKRYDETNPICQFECEWRNECHKICDEDKTNFALRERIQNIFKPPIQQNPLSGLHTPNLEPRTKQDNTHKKIELTKEQITEEEERQKCADVQWRAEEQTN